MARNGSGVYSPPASNYPAVAGTLIEASDRNAIDADIATALTNSLAVNGESTVTNNIPLANNKIIGLKTGTVATDAANLGQVQSGASTLLASVSGADTITATMSPTLTAYAAGQKFNLIPVSDNTGAVTLNINALGAKAVTKNGENALSAADLAAGVAYDVVYDGTRFQVLNTLEDIDISGKADLAGATFTGDIVMSSAMLKMAKGADVASATALPLIADGNYFEVTGTTDIVTMDTVGVGTVVWLKYTSVLTITHHATNLICKTGANITTAANDTACWIEYASGDWQMLAYEKEDGRSLVSAIFTESFESSEQTITVNSTLAVAHGLSASPKLVTMELICKTAESGYSIGDVLEFPATAGTITDVGHYGVGIKKDSTNLDVKFMGFLRIASFSGSSSVDITPSSWRAIFRAYV